MNSGASDQVIWSVINHQFCAYKIKTPNESTFCRNEYNVTGMCNRQSCPLANSRYATVREIKGRIYLYSKSVERAHMPAKLWERRLLPKNYLKALEMIDQELIYNPPFLVHKCKQRLTKLTQYLIKARQLAQRDLPTMIGIKNKMRRREGNREQKALAAARLEKVIEKELLERLKSKAYGDAPLNVNEAVWQKVLALQNGEEQDSAEEDEDEDVGKLEYVEDEEEELEDLEDIDEFLGSFDEAEDNLQSKKRKLEIEYETEDLDLGEELER